jgi:hypothetical protein
MRVTLAHVGPTVSALLLLHLAACGGPHDANLFRSSGTIYENGGAGNAGAAGGGAGNAGGSSGLGGVGGSPEGAAGSALDSAGVGSGSANGGAASGGSSSVGDGGASGATPAGGSPGLSDCARFGADASYFSETRHCYVVVHEPATYADAQTQCETLGGHLLTLSSQAENDFAWNLNSEEHWLGASDGKEPNSPTGGKFTWVTGEPFAYTNWSTHQPDASNSDCGASGMTGPCYEHCAFQWTGGEHDGEWNDRFCLHTIATICEIEAAKQ